MIGFERLKFSAKEDYQNVLSASGKQGCEYSFVNLYLWGIQRVAWVEGCVAFFSHFGGRSIYPFPIGTGDKRKVLEQILEDSRQRGIPLRLSGMNAQDKEDLETWFPGQFVIRSVRDGFDYVYSIDALADLTGRKYQKKRNHANKFRKEHPNYQVVELTPCNLPLAQHMVNDWYQTRFRSDPHGDYLLENVAMARAFQNFTALGLEGILVMEEDQVLGVTLASRLSEDTFDVHFEKAREDVDGAYTVTNQEMARYLRLKHPELKFLNREDDMGLEGLRKAKESYHPDHLVEKFYATYLEDIHAEL